MSMPQSAPTISMTLFAVLRAVRGYDHLKDPRSRENYQRQLLKWYRRIPNVQELNETAFKELCFDENGDPKKAIILKLIPNAVRFETETLVDMYEAVEEFITKA